MSLAQGDLTLSVDRIAPKCDGRALVLNNAAFFSRTAALGHTKTSKTEYRATRIFGQDGGIARRPAIPQLWAIHQQGEHQIRADGSNDLRDRILTRQILANQHTHGEPVAERYEVNIATPYVNTLPTIPRSGQSATEVILQNLPAIQTPSMVFQLYLPHGIAQWTRIGSLVGMDRSQPDRLDRTGIDRHIPRSCSRRSETGYQ